MPQVKIHVVHTIEQYVVLDLSEDELNNFTYEDAVVNCPFDEHQPSLVDTDILDAQVDGKEHYF